MTRDPYTARPYQQEVIDDALRLLSDRDRVQVVMACGTGKTLVAQRIAESLTAGNDAPLILCLPGWTGGAAESQPTHRSTRVPTVRSVA